MILASVLFGIYILPFSEDASPPIVLTMMFMLWHVLMTSEDLASARSSSTQKNETLLY